MKATVFRFFNDKGRVMVAACKSDGNAVELIHAKTLSDLVDFSGKHPGAIAFEHARNNEILPGPPSALPLSIMPFAKLYGSDVTVKVKYWPKVIIGGLGVRPAKYTLVDYYLKALDMLGIIIIHTDGQVSQVGNLLSQVRTPFGTDAYNVVLEGPCALVQGAHGRYLDPLTGAPFDDWRVRTLRGVPYAKYTPQQEQSLFQVLEFLVLNSRGDINPYENIFTADQTSEMLSPGGSLSMSIGDLRDVIASRTGITRRSNVHG